MQQELTQNSFTLEQQLIQVFLTSDSPQKALLRATQIIGEAFEVDCCMVVLQHAQEESRSICWSLNQPALFAPFAIELSSITGFGVESWSIPDLLAISDLQSVFQQETSRVAEANCEATVSALLKNYPQFRSALISRTEFQGDTNGMVILMRSQPCAWTNADVKRLKSLSPQMAIAISQAHLDQQVQQQTRYQTLIDQLSVAIRNNWSLQQTFRLAVEGTASALQVSRGIVLLLKYVDPLHRSRSCETVPKAKATVAAEWFQPDELKCSSVATHPVSDDFSPELHLDTSTSRSFWASDCIICRQILTGKAEPIVLPNPYAGTPDTVKTDPDELEKIASVFKLEALPSLLLMPLENQGTILGCLVLQHHRYRTWSPEELSFVKVAAAQLSTAIIQTRTIQQIQAVVQERTAQLQQSLDVQAKLYEKTRQQVEQLRRLNQEREEFLSTISHELRTPLTSMTLAIRMLRQTDLPPDRRALYLDILEQQCVQETNLINDLLALRKLESNLAPTQLQKLDMRHLIRDVVQSMKPSWVEKDLTFDLDIPEQPMILYTDSDSLNRILVELLTNAKKYSERGSTIYLRLAHEDHPHPDRLTLTLCNIGSGISSEELPHIFDKFRRGQGMTKQAVQGTGLGLALVKGLVDHLNGAIAVTSQPLKQSSSWETSFTVTLPQCPDGMICNSP